MKHTHILLDADDGLVISVKSDDENLDWGPILVFLAQNDED